VVEDSKSGETEDSEAREEIKEKFMNYKTMKVRKAKKRTLIQRNRV